MVPTSRRLGVAALLAAFVNGQSTGGVVTQYASWVPVDAASATVPSSGAALVANATHIVSIGGTSAVGTVIPAAAFQVSSSTWTYMPTFPGAAAAVSNGAVAQVDAQNAYVFGGVLASGALSNALLKITPQGITTVVTNGTAPPARQMAAAVYLSGCYTGPPVMTGATGACLVVFGGRSATVAYMSDLYVLDMRPATPLWSSPVTSGDAPPAGRVGASAVATGDNTQAIFFGGATAAGATNDLFAFAPGGFATALDRELANLARPNGLQANTSMSTTDPVWAGHSDRAVDGLINTNCNGQAGQTSSAQTIWNLCTGTTSEPNPWWRVDLGAVKPIQTLKVWGRTDCCVDRIDGFQVYVSNVDSFATAVAGGACFNPYITVGDPPAIIDMTDASNAGRCASARYVWITLPGTVANPRYLSLIEVQVLSKLPWVWRHLSGIAEVATNKPSTQSSTELCCAGGDAHRGNDGSTSNNDYNQGSCTHTNDNELQPENWAWWTVDLEQAYDVSSVEFWPRTDCCTGRGTRYNIALGQSRDIAFNFKVPNMPANVQPVQGQTPLSWTFNLATPVRTRFATVYRPFLLNNDNILNVCEFRVFAQLLRNQPSARYGAAMAGYGGTIVVFGGTDAGGFKLNDVRVFDPVNVKWLPAASPLGLPPTGRSAASVLVLGNILGATYANSIVVFGGSSATDTLGDLTFYNAPSCPRLSLTGATLLSTGHTGTYQPTQCQTGFSSTNNGAQLVCDPTTGIWQGLYNLATGSICLAPPLTGAAVTGVTAVSSTSARVSFSLPAGATYAVVSADAEPMYFQTFNAGAPTDFAAAWRWTDATTFSRYVVNSGRIEVLGTRSADCTGVCPGGPACVNNCPQLSRAFPSDAASGAVDPNNYGFEALVSSDSNTVQPNMASAIGLQWDHGNGVYSLALFAGIRVIPSAVNYGSWQVGFSTPTGACSNWITWNFPIYKMWMRIERSGTSGNSTFRVAFREHLLDHWTHIGAPCAETSLPGGQLPAASQRLAVLSKNTNAAASAITYVDDFLVTNLACQTGGQTRFVASSPAVIGGLTAGGNYRFSVAPATPSLVGTISAPSSAVALPAPPALNATRLASLSTPNSILSNLMGTLQTGAASPNPAANGINGNTDQANNYFETLLPCGDFGCYWQVDMGQQVDVMWVSIYNRADTDANAQRAAGISIFVSGSGGTGFAETGRLCSPAPASLLDPDQGYYADVPCFNNVGTPLTGRYITIQAPMGIPVSLTQVLVYAGNSCPAYASPNGIAQPGSSCGAGSPFGAACAMSCPTGTEAVSGASLTHCRGFGWDQPPLLCQPTCQVLPPPQHVGACTESLVIENFDQLPDNTTVGRWFSPDPAEGLNTAWFVTDGQLNAGGAWGCFEELFLLVGDDEVRDFRGDFTFSVDVFSADRVGIVRMLDEENFMRFSLDFNSNEHILDAVIGGVYEEVTDAHLTLQPNTWYQVKMTKVGTTLTVFIDGIELLVTDFARLASGYVGVYAGTTATFDHLAVTTACNGGVCTTGAPQDRCTYTCNPGYTPVGNATQICTMSADGTTASWVGVPLTCALPLPTFNAATRYVPELAARYTAVGAPLVAYITDPTATLLFAIVSGPNTTSGAPTFGIDACSGQIWVNANPLASYATARTYTLNVSVTVVGSGQLVYARVTVNVQQVTQAPVIASGQVFSLSAAATVGTIFGNISFSTASTSGVVFSVAVDGSSGIVGITNSSLGLLGVLSTVGLDYYVGRRQFIMQLNVRDAANPALTGTGQVTINVVEAPTPPTVATQVVPIPWTSSAGTGTSSTSPVVATLAANLFNSTLYTSTLTYALIPYPQAATVCGIKVSNATGVNATEYPTTTGLVGAGSLFSIAPTTGIVSVALVPTGTFPPWNARTPAAVSGYLALASYPLCVNVTTRFNKWTAQTVTVAVTTSSASGAVITGYRLATGPLAGTAGLLVDTVVPTTIYFVGSGFGAAASNTSGTVKANYTNSLYKYVASGCAVFNSTLITCNTVSGIGANLLWTVYLSGAIVPSVVPLTTSYQLPIVTSLANNTNLPSLGGVEIVLNGRYFGQTGGGVLTYGPATNPSLYTCTLQKPSWKAAGVATDSQSSCIAARGAGANLQWSLNVGGQIIYSTALSPTLTYAPPAVTSVAVAGLTNGTNATTALRTLDTAGGTTLTVTGTNFGGNPANVLVVTYGSRSAGAPQYTMPCARLPTTSTTTLTCTTVPGVGWNLAISVSVEGQSSGPKNITGFAYAPPVVTAVTGGRTLSTAGGTTIAITGDFFGPGTPSPDWVRYGPVSPTGIVRYSAVNCAVVVAETQILCVTVPGTGGSISGAGAPGPGYALQLSVGGQPSPVFAAGLGYAPPMITAFQPVSGLDTRGGSLVQLTGLNFGPGNDPTVSISASYSARAGSTTLTFVPTNCSVTSPNTQITCTTAPGAGTSLSWSVVVDGQRSVSPTTSYAPPVITAILDSTGNPLSAMLNPNVPTTLTLSGSNFGSPRSTQFVGGGVGGVNATAVVVDLIQTVTYGPSGTEYKANFTHIDDTRIVVTVGPASGVSCYFRITVGGQTTTATTPVFDFMAPQIIAITPNHGPTSNPPGFNATFVTVAVMSPPLLDPLYDLVVKIGSGATWATVIPIAPETPQDIAAATNPDGSVNLMFALPPAWAGQGLGVQLVPVDAPQGSQPSEITAATTFNYDAPVIMEVFVVPAQFTAGSNATFRALERRLQLAPPCPWRAGNPTWTCDGSYGQLYQIIIIGRNFAANPATLQTPDPVTRELEYMLPVVNGSTATPVWAEASWVSSGAVDAAGVTVAFWSDSVISAYTTHRPRPSLLSS